MPTFDRLAQSFRRHLRAENKAAKTVDTYMEAVRQFGVFMAHDLGLEPTDVSRENVEHFIGHLLDTRSPATANNRFRALQQFFKWLDTEGHIRSNPMIEMKPPYVPEEPVPVCSPEAVRALLATCGGRRFEDDRDAAIIMVLYDSGLRRGGLLGLGTTDVCLDAMQLEVTEKGSRRRIVPFGRKTAKALDRYELARTRHPYAYLDSYWISRKGRFGESGLALMLKRRCIQAGIRPIHPHQLRHTWAHEYQADGGQEGDLQRLGGWRSRRMLDRYGASAAGERARRAYRKHSPGDRL
jgi:site-specific recombinase XerD